VGSHRSYVGFSGLVALTVAVGLLLARRPRVADVLSVVPDDAWLVVYVDVEKLRASGLAPPLVSAGPVADGVGDVAARCGFDPLSRLRNVVVAAPEHGEKGDFALAFHADVTVAQLSACAREVMAARGGKPVSSQRSGYSILEDGADAVHAHVAYREGGPYLVGQGEWLDRMMDLAVKPPGWFARDARGGREVGEHSSLRASLAGGRHVSGSAGAWSNTSAAPVLEVTALLPSELRERLKRELAAEGGSEADTSASVLAVKEAGVALTTTGPAGSTTGLAAELRCENAAACAVVRDLIERKRADAAGSLLVRAVGLGPLLDSVKLDLHGATLSIVASGATDDIAHALGVALRLMAGSKP
jgi:hypothetical protein